MNCQETLEKLDDFLDGALDERECADVETHLGACASCNATWVREQKLRAALRALPVEGPSEDFYERALQHAMAHDRRRPHFLVGTALAAGLVLLMVTGLWFPASQPPSEQHQQSIPGLTISLNKTQDVKLVFNAPYELAQATFTVVLPPGVELLGYPEQREITWEGSLRKGKNLLVLPLIARSAGGGELRAYVTHNGKRKVFRLHMAVEQQQGAVPDVTATLS